MSLLAIPSPANGGPQSYLTPDLIDAHVVYPLLTTGSLPFSLALGLSRDDNLLLPALSHHVPPTLPQRPENNLSLCLLWLPRPTSRRVSVMSGSTCQLVLPG